MIRAKVFEILLVEKQNSNNNNNNGHNINGKNNIHDNNSNVNFVSFGVKFFQFNLRLNKMLEIFC